MNASWLRQLLIAALILSYALLEHYSNSVAAPRGLGAALAVAPPLVALLLLARRIRWPWLLPSILMAVAVVLLRFWPDIEQNFGWLYLLQQCGVYLILAATFGRSLLPGQIPLCNRWATMLHGALPEEAIRYTRAVTVAWTGFFATIVVLSAALYAAAPRSTWSVFSNFLILPLAALMFAGEYALRRRRLPAMAHASLADTMRVYLADTRRSPHC